MSNPNALAEASTYEDVHEDPIYQALDQAQQQTATAVNGEAMGWDYLEEVEYSVITPDRWMAEAVVYGGPGAYERSFAQNQTAADPVENYANALEAAAKFFANEGQHESMQRIAQHSADLAMRGAEAVFDTISTSRIGGLASAGAGVRL